MVCHQYNSIFVHIPKCAGQSVEKIFLDAVGLSWATRAPLLLRHNDRPELGPPRLAHLTAGDYVAHKYVSPQQFANYFKFAIVRNPWDRMVSLYKYLGFYRCANFKQFVMKYLTQQLWKDQYWFVRPQCEFIYDQRGECLVDYVGRFELLSEAMSYVGRQVGLQSVSVPQVNKSSRKFHRPHSGLGDLGRYLVIRYIKRAKMPRDYRNYYDAESISQVAELYKRDIETLGYEFDPRCHDHTVQSALVR